MRAIAILACLPLFGCATGPFPAPFGATIELPDEVVLGSSSAILTEDGIGYLVIGNAGVLDEDGYPLANVEVEINTMWGGIYVIPETAVQLVDYPAAPDDVQSAEAAREKCDTDGDGAIDADAPEWCSWHWDAESGAYYEFGSGYASTDSGYRPTYFVGGTDSRGLLRFYLFVDSLPGSEDGDGYSFEDVTVLASIGVDSDTMTVGASD